MKASFNWIKEFVNVTAGPQEVADRLTLAGLEIEGISSLGEGLDKVFTATLLKCEKHPDADRLTLCEVRAGDKQYSLVCGAKNMKVGDRVALAVPGAKLPNGMEIQETVIRKVKSHGMLCSEKELGLAVESEGILILPSAVPEGLPLNRALSLEDTIYEVNVTPNRGDCLSMAGLAREVAAAFERPWKPREARFRAKKIFTAKEIEVSNQSPELCPRYTCRIVRGVKVGVSPIHIQRRLESCGIRSINNIVDATNYVMLELGQPLHAFDLTQIRKGRILIRNAKPGEVLKTLDEQERNLLPSDLVIADGERVLALAGVMGGKDSGVEVSSKDLLLESACFVPQVVRKTAKRLGLQTESSYRFERWVDPNGCDKALDRLTELILELAGGEAVSEIIDCYPRLQKPREIILRGSYLQKVSGVEIEGKKLLNTMDALGITGQEKKKGEYLFKVPTFRSDLTREIDLVEEAVRLHGYNHIPTSFPRLSLAEIPPPCENRLDRLRELLADWGFSEVLHYSFTSPQLLHKFEQKYSPAQVLLNPISEEMSVMRPSLLPQMVQTLQQNIFNGNKNLKLFEIRPVYFVTSSPSKPFQESWRLCLGMSGNRRPLHFKEKEEEVSLWDLKGYLNALIRQYLGGSIQEKADFKPFLHPKRQVLLEWLEAAASTERQRRPEQAILGLLGEVHPALIEELGLRLPLVLAEINLDLFLTGKKNLVQFQKVSSFPSVWRDLNLVVEETISHGEVARLIREHGGSWVQDFELFDVYRGEPLPKGKKALTYTIEYATPERTMTDEEVNQAREDLLKKLKKEIGASLR